MDRLRSLIRGSIKVSRPVLSKVRSPIKVQRAPHSHDGPPQAFDNMPFDIPNRYVASVFFAVFFGLGLWAPFLILWYSMAKRTL